MIYKRNIKSSLEAAISRSPIVILIGARQTGKTTLVKEIAAEKNYRYITFDDLSILAAARSDPQGFIQNLNGPIILDEVQRVPEIFLPIKKEVDLNRAAGRFILTGSANPLFIPRIADALVGRVELLELFPLSQGEILGKKEQFIDNAFKGEISANSSFKGSDNIIEKFNRTDLYQKIFRGGYPLIQNLGLQAADNNSMESWFNSYITTILYREVKDISNITDLTEFPKLLQFLATRVANLLNVADLSRSTQIPSSTLHRYLALLKSLFILNLQLPWSNNLGKRFVKSPKISLIDSGLLCFLLHADVNALESSVVPIGAIVEDFVLGELRKQATWNLIKVNLFHFRTVTGIEVDIILEDRKGNIVAIEVKHSSTISVSDFKGLKYLQETIKDRFIQGFVIYTGDEIIPFGDKLKAIPISVLWS